MGCQKAKVHAGLGAVQASAPHPLQPPRWQKLIAYVNDGCKLQEL